MTGRRPFFPEAHPFGGVLHEDQFVRPDGTVITGMLQPPGLSAWPVLEDGIEGGVAIRTRAAPDGPWKRLAWFPDGYPGHPDPEPPDGIRKALRALEG